MSDAQLNMQGRPSIRLSLPTLGAISSVLGVIIFLGGWVLGYMTFRSKMDTMTDTVASVKIDNAALRDSFNKLTNDFTEMKTDIKYISQGMAELRLAAIPKR